MEWLKLFCFGLVISVYSKDNDESTCADGHCADLKHEKEKYTKSEETKEKWQNYFSLIKTAVESYKKCSEDCYKLQRRSDFRFWIDRGGIKEEDFLQAKQEKLGEHYQIINHKLYRQKECIFYARCSGNEHFILKVIDTLPDMEMIINTHDWPKVKHWSSPSPVLSFSKTPEERDILYPAWTFWEGGPAVWPIYPTGLGRWDLMIEALNKKAKEWPWEKKLKKGFFRGSRTSDERDPLVLLSRDQPELVDAQYTKNQGWRSEKDTLYMKPAKEVPLEEHCQYKYLFNFRGVAASFRFKHLFLCNSLVFHVGEEWIEFFYSEMKPWVHYIPVSTDLTEVQDLIEFAKSNDEIVREITERGRIFVKKHLRMADVQDYWFRLLKRYSKLMKWNPKKRFKFHRN